MVQGSGGRRPGPGMGGDVPGSGGLKTGPGIREVEEGSLDQGAGIIRVEERYQRDGGVVLGSGE